MHYPASREDIVSAVNFNIHAQQSHGDFECPSGFLIPTFYLRLPVALVMIVAQDIGLCVEEHDAASFMWVGFGGTAGSGRGGWNT